MATKATTRNISVQRNRDYSQVFQWTSTLNDDVYNFYLQARENPQKGYMRRLKASWDEKYPAHANLTEKHLRERAIFVESKRRIISTTNQSEVETPRVLQPPASTNDNVLILDDQTNNNSVSMEIVNIELKTNMHASFEKHYTKVIDLSLKERSFSTRVTCNVRKEHLTAINNVISDFIKDKATLTFWQINCIQYCASISVLGEVGKLRETKSSIKGQNTPRWLIQAESQINAIRRNLSYITLIMKCDNRVVLTKKQKCVEAKVRKMCGNLRKPTLAVKLAKLKHQLTVCNVKLRDNKKKAERSRVNLQFSENQNQVFRDWKGNKIEVKNPPSVEKVTSFWADIWGKDTPVNLNSKWYDDLQNFYCKEATGKCYTITEEDFRKVISKMPNNKAPGTDKIVSYWLKYLTPLHPQLLSLLKEVNQNTLDLPTWLVTSRTVITPKNADTHLEKNYRPIACLNTTYKLFTGILNTFLEDHCSSNNIIAVEQAGGKKGSWGCTDQLLINKMVFDEVREYRRNLFSMYFDYKKAFDSISHTWLIEALKLAKVHPSMIAVIESLIDKWATQVHLQAEKSLSITDVINYLTGLFQGDCLSLLLFVICVNPLSFLLNRECEGYLAGPTGERHLKLTNLVFVDDLKTYAHNKETAMHQLDIITRFSQDIGMKFGADKCAYIYIERGKRVTCGESVEMNGLQMSEMKENDSYKYLGLDEDIAYKGDMNKDRVKKEYFNRISKIWKSELFSKNKVLAHNIFANSIFTLTFGILDWTKEEIEQIDIRTRKLLTFTGNFHRNSSVSRLYATRKDGGRGLNSIYDNFVVRIITLRKHLDVAAEKNPYLRGVITHEKDKLVRIAEEFAKALNVEENSENLSHDAKCAIKKNHLTTYQAKSQHGFIHRKQEKIEGFNKRLTNNWINGKGLISHTEGYLFAMQEQEINTKALQAKREQALNTGFDKSCRFCHKKTEDIFHILASCERLSASMYLPMRHDEVGKEVYNAVIKHHFPASKYMFPQPTWVNRHIEIWWDIYVETVPKTKHNKPDMVIWNKETKRCSIVDFCIPLDENVHAQEKNKLDIYQQLSINLSRLYPSYTYEIIPIVLGATGLITDSLTKYLMVLFNEDTKRVKHVTPKLQRKALIGSMRVLKSALSKKI